MKKILAVVLLLALVISCMPNNQRTVNASGNKPVITYNNGVMSGNGLLQINDGNYGTGYVSEDNPDMTEGTQYIQFAWANDVKYNSVTLYSTYCGTTSKAGQAPTKWKIQTSTDGATFNDATTVTAEWNDSDDSQSKTAEFAPVGNYKYMRIVIQEANLDWAHYVITEVEFATVNVGVYRDTNNTLQYGKAATITYNNGTMNGNGLLLVADGDYETGYVSEDNPSMDDGVQYIQYDWNAPIDINLLTLYSKYCGTSETAGQAPTEWDIQVSKDGAVFTNVGTVTKDWYKNDELQSKNVKFAVQEDIVALRVVIKKANLDWNHYAILEIEVGQAEEGFEPTDITGNVEPELVGVYKDSNNTTQYGKAATVTYNNATMNGMGLLQVADGDYTRGYVSEDNPNMADQYIQYSWVKPIDINLVTLYAQYCGTSETAGQAPTEWDIQVSKDGTTFTDVCTVTKEWYKNDDLQSRNAKFAVQEDIVALRVVIKKANLDWNHYAILEIEVGQAEEGFEPTDITGTVEPELVGVYKDSNNTTQYGKAATVTYNNATMNGMGLLQVADGDYTTGYVSEENPNMTDQYIQYSWVKPIDIDLVTLYAQYCGTSETVGQAPTEWDIQVSKDGIVFTDVCTVTKDWYKNDDLQSKNAKFAVQEDIVALRVVIKKANLDWNHYAILEIEVGQTERGFEPTDITGTVEQELSGVYKDANGVTQYGKAATVTYNNGFMNGMGLLQVADGDYTTGYVSEENPNMKAQYIQYTWEKPIDINMVTLYTQYCGTRFKEGQAPTKWKIQVSKDGASFTDVCSVSKKWRSNDNLQSKTAQFDLQEDIVAVRVVITEAMLNWNHYAVLEIEVGQSEPGYVAKDLTGVDPNASPETGDVSSPLLAIGTMVVSLVMICTVIYQTKKKED